MYFKIDEYTLKTLIQEHFEVNGLIEAESIEVKHDSNDKEKGLITVFAKY